ncbi:MAG TPA: LysR family transcriptional regulator [Steroidobacteraceae bacterium]|nr:LysR family transcriptional regulator [Steroidobacteraceae bacterium]
MCGNVRKNVASIRRRQNPAFGAISFLIARRLGGAAINSLLNLNAFLKVARLGSFSGAARELGVAPSVITKRIDQLEEELGTRLLLRSTRGLTLTAAAETLLPRFVRLAAEFDELFKDALQDDHGIEGHLRIKSPTTVTSEFLGRAYAEFLQVHPNVTLEIVLVDRSVNPLEEGFDCSIGALPVSYPNVVDVPLCPYDVLVCCAPSYLRGRREPRHPTDLTGHDCLTTTLFRNTWVFESQRGALSVEVHSRLHACDARVIHDAVRGGLGIAVLARYLADEDIRAGRLVPLLRDFPLATHWLKVLVPQIKMRRPVVRELVAFLKTRLQGRDLTTERTREPLASNA